MPTKTTSPTKKKKRWRKRMSEDRLLTTEEVADRLRLDVETVRRYLRDGKLKGKQFGNRGGWRILESDLDSFISDDKEIKK